MKNVLLTGINGGIGKGVAENLLSDGASVIGLCREICNEMRDMAEVYPGQLFLYEADINDTGGLTNLIKGIVSECGPIGGFVHCAGFDKMSPIYMAKKDDYESLWRIHALVPMLIIGAISKKKLHNEDTSIVLLSSQAAHEGAMGHAAYASAKGAIEGYLAPAAAELMDRGIRINEVCLAPVKTPMASGWLDKLTESEMEKIINSYPLGIGEVEDAANLITFLLSDKSRWINGQIITADGGHSVRRV